ncbi:MAG: hypothetical protein GY915_01290, partial [bacterium]|nr:hypothetical protein [bacterium]
NVSIKNLRRPQYLGNSGISGAPATIIVKSSGQVKKSLRPKLRPGSQKRESESIQLVDSKFLTEVLKGVTDGRATVRPEEIIKKPVATVDNIVVPKRPKNADKKRWSISIGLFNSEYKAEKELLRTALSEVGTLKDGQRVVLKTRVGFDANFKNLTWDNAMQACERLRARSVKCSVKG